MRKSAKLLAQGLRGSICTRIHQSEKSLQLVGDKRKRLVGTKEHLLATLLGRKLDSCREDICRCLWSQTGQPVDDRT
ncbi:hypothetical protein DPMN_177862 [Dreissena polymorpha]|uniref:Uncharacterized protein n=1 Tax=Dreissena polymorpha TaxID=45954 RepID=A0A9D4IKX5_DREPO|nr:hypothetical protein DPMN_177862 [Dreissena polymorpha]